MEGKCPNQVITSPRGFKDAIGSGYIEAYFEGWWEKSIGLSVILEHSEIFYYIYKTFENIL